MASFAYKGRGYDGAPVYGTIDANADATAAQMLMTRKIKPVDLTAQSNKAS